MRSRFVGQKILDIILGGDQMNTRRHLKGFTLLEVLVVIVIIGILASLAMPRFFRTVEYSRATEALAQLSAVRSSMQRCYLLQNSYTGCTAFTLLDVEDPGTLTGTHFTYALGTGATTFLITATRNTVDGGSTAERVTINQDGTKTGSGLYTGIR